MDYIKKVINEISCLITDTVMTEQEGSRRCITTEDLNGFEEWITWLEKANDGNQTNSELANCAIFDVSNSLPDDVPLFIDWLDEYYTHAGNDDLYKRKDNGKIEPQRKLYNDYKRAYKLGNDC